MKGTFVFSLDFELFWGVKDLVNLKVYRENLLGVRIMLPQLLSLFNKYEINATFATVGFLFFENKEELIAALPQKKPSYKNKNLSPYLNFFEDVGQNELGDPFHFGKSLVKQIIESKQEIGSHSFCHYYCNEPGQTLEEFESDINQAVLISKKFGQDLKSFVFPRNQVNEGYLNVLVKAGFTNYRGNLKHFMYEYDSFPKLRWLQRLIRIADSYINLSGYNNFLPQKTQSGKILNIPASRLLRPFNSRLSFLEWLRLRRIKLEMTFAAKTKTVYHLWGHPHNYGINIEKNLAFLEEILKHYSLLRNKYGFINLSMKDLAKEYGL